MRYRSEEYEPGNNRSRCVVCDEQYANAVTEDGEAVHRDCAQEAAQDAECAMCGGTETVGLVGRPCPCASATRGGGR